MPLIFMLSVFFISFQPEVQFLLGFSFSEYLLSGLEVSFFGFFSFLGLTDNFVLNNNFIGYDLNNKTRLSYNYSFRTHFAQTYLHAAYNDHIRPYKNLLNMDRMFGDYNLRSLHDKRLQPKGRHHFHPRSYAAKEIFTLLYSYTVDIYALKGHHTTHSSILFYFKKQHLYSLTEMGWASIYLGFIYILSMTHVKNIEESVLLLRETEEVDEEYSQSNWFYFRDNRRGIIPPKIPDNEEIDFAYPQHPVEWDDLGNLYRWESHFFNIMFSFIIGWGVSQSALSIFIYDGLVDLHFVDWTNTLLYLFVFWRIFFYPQYIFLFSRFSIRKFIYLNLMLKFYYRLQVFVLKRLYEASWTFFNAVCVNFLKLDSLRVSLIELNFKKFLFNISRVQNYANEVIRFYRYIYSFFQKDLNLFERRSKYEILLTSNLYFLESSGERLDALHYFLKNKDSNFSDITFFTDFFVRNYFYATAFYMPENLYLLDNRVYLLSIPPFPFYLNSTNLNPLPIWGGDLFFNFASNTVTLAEPSTTWFFTAHYNKVFGLSLPNMALRSHASLNKSLIVDK